MVQGNELDAQADGNVVEALDLAQHIRGPAQHSLASSMRYKLQAGLVTKDSNTLLTARPVLPALVTGLRPTQAAWRRLLA